MWGCVLGYVPSKFYKLVNFCKINFLLELIEFSSVPPDFSNFQNCINSLDGVCNYVAYESAIELSNLITCNLKVVNLWLEFAFFMSIMIIFLYLVKQFCL